MRGLVVTLGSSLATVRINLGGECRIAIYNKALFVNWNFRWIFLEIVVFVIHIDIEANSNEFLFFVTARQYNGSVAD